MDQVKIGKLIAMLRKEKGLTQSELGEKVGVSDGAVSKWERGATCPDISIINTLSKTLGITSDELLTGELSKETSKRMSRNKSLKTIIPQLIILLIIATISVFIILRNDNDVYSLESTGRETIVEGKVIFKGNKLTITINGIAFRDKNINRIKITNYEYRIKHDKDILFKKGNIDEEQLLASTITISEFKDRFKINYSEEINDSKQAIIHDGLELKITFLTENSEIVEKNIKIKLVK